MDPMPLWRCLNLRDNPFAGGFPTARPFLGDAHGRTSAVVGEAIRQHHPLILFTGETGSGRTTLVHALLADPDLAAIPTMLAAADVSDFMSVLRSLLATVDHEGAAVVPSYHLGSRLLAILDREPDLHLLLALDDADHIDPSVIEDAIRLAAVVNAHQPQVSLLLVGEPKLVKSVNSVLPNTLHAPTPTVIHLAPLSGSGVAAYIGSRLAASGYDGALPFTVAAVARIADAARGLPAHVDRLCAACFDAAGPVKLPMHIGFVARVISSLSASEGAKAEAIHDATPVASVTALAEAVPVEAVAAEAVNDMAIEATARTGDPAIVADVDAVVSSETPESRSAVGTADADAGDALTARLAKAMERSDQARRDAPPPPPVPHDDDGATREERISFAVDAPSFGYGRLTTELVPVVGGFADSIQLTAITPMPPATVPPPTMRSASTGSRRRWLLVTLGLLAGGASLWALDRAFDGRDRLSAMMEGAVTPGAALVSAPVSAQVSAPVSAPVTAGAVSPSPAVPRPAAPPPAPPPAAAPVATIVVPPITPPPALAPLAAPPPLADPASPVAVKDVAVQEVAQVQPPASDPPSQNNASPPPAETVAPPPALPAAETVAPPVAAVPPVVATGAPAAKSATTPANSLEAAKLIARGESYLAQADIASAQLFFRLAADRGSGPAARAMAATLDPVALAATPIPGARANAADAVRWYQRAVALGDGEAGAALARLTQRLREQAARGDAAAAAIVKTLP